MTYRAELAGRDWIEIDVDGDACAVRASGCLPFLRAVAHLRRQLPVAAKLLTYDFNALKLETHAEVLIREVLLRARNEWHLPYADVELCHCRAVATAVVDQAIVAGARTAERVAKLTSAGSACGSCRGDTEAIIKYRWSP